MSEQSGIVNARLEPDAYEAWVYLVGVRDSLASAAYHLDPLDAPQLKQRLSELRALIARAIEECSDE